MWFRKDIVIGTDHPGNSWCKCAFDFGYGDTWIAENRMSYSVTVRYPNIALTILKNTDEGQALTRMIADKVTSDVMREYLLEISFIRLKPAEILQMMEYAVADAEEKGYNKAKAELRDWLGVR
jgi:hypothetical protein